jgi:hypothetical protein
LRTLKSPTDLIKSTIEAVSILMAYEFDLTKNPWNL